MDKLVLSNCQMRGSDLVQLMRVLISSKNQRIRELNLSQNVIHRNAADALAQSLLSQNKTKFGLQTLDLSRTHIADGEFTIIASALEENPHLRHLILSHNNITPQSVDVLNRLVDRNKNCITIDLSYNPIMQDRDLQLVGWKVGFEATVANHAEAFNKRLSRFKDTLKDKNYRLREAFMAVDSRNTAWLTQQLKAGDTSLDSRLNLFAEQTLLQEKRCEARFQSGVIDEKIRQLEKANYAGDTQKLAKLDAFIKNWPKILEAKRDECIRGYKEDLSGCEWRYEHDDSKEIIAVTFDQHQALVENFSRRLQEISKAYTMSASQVNQSGNLLPGLREARIQANTKLATIDSMYIGVSDQLGNSDASRKKLLSDFRRDIDTVPEEYHSVAWDIREVLLDYAIDVNTQDAETGDTLLHKAVSCRYRPAIQLLLDRGGDFFLKNRVGKSAFEVAIEGGRKHFEVLTEMIVPSRVSQLFGVQLERELEELEQYERYKDVLDKYAMHWILRDKSFWLFRMIVGFEQRKKDRQCDLHEYFLVLKQNWTNGSLSALSQQVNDVITRAARGRFGGLGTLHKGMLAFAKEVRGLASSLPNDGLGRNSMEMKKIHGVGIVGQEGDRQKAEGDRQKAEGDSQKAEGGSSTQQIAPSGTLSSVRVFNASTARDPLGGQRAWEGTDHGVSRGHVRRNSW